jgi:hypothetical protein
MRLARAKQFLETLIASSALLSKRSPVWLTVSLLLASFSVFIAYIARLNDVLHDIFHAMALAREVVLTGVFPTADVFAFSPTLNPTVHHEWGFGLICFIITANPLGDTLLMSLRFLLIAIVLLSCYRVCRARGGDPLLFALGLLLVLPFFWVGFSTLRAQQFTLTFLALQLVMQESDWKNNKSWVLMWLVMLVCWLNIHAGFIVGAGLIALHGIERCCEAWFRSKSLLATFQQTWHLWIAAPTAFASLWINPYGSEYITYLAHGLTMPRPQIGEWWPLWTIMNPVQTLICFAIAVGLMAYTARHRQWHRLTGFLFLILCAIMAFKHVRHASIFAVVWLAYVPAWLTFTPLGKKLHKALTQSPKTTYQWTGGFGTAGIAFFLWFQGYTAYLPVNEHGQRGNYPLGAVSYLQRHNLQGRFITDFDSGAYVTWRLYPRILVSLDGRYEAAFQPGVLEEHLEFFYAAPNSATILDRWKADGIIVPSGTPLSEKISSSGESRMPVQLSGSDRRWKCVYRDPGTSVWIDADQQAPVEFHDQLPSNGKYPN